MERKPVANPVQPGSNSGGLSVVTSDYKSSDFTVATQDCTPEYYTGDLRVQYTEQTFLCESCGATITGNFTVAPGIHTGFGPVGMHQCPSTKSPTSNLPISNLQPANLRPPTSDLRPANFQPALQHTTQRPPILHRPTHRPPTHHPISPLPTPADSYDVGFGHFLTRTFLPFKSCLSLIAFFIIA